MSDVAIHAENLSKRYRIGKIERYKALRDVLTDTAAFRTFASALRMRQSAKNGQVPSDFIWALKDLSFEIRHGEVVGVIGRNGAGKSTLLKILSRITEPTEGYARISGRVGSLLEVGTGFHPELTGRENIYLNGAILGMRKREIERKFDEIVAFAEVERFIDTMVKHYSSGMYLRLAFAVAAHLEPDIFLVDEVLAVGDAAFQQKCLGKVGDIAKQGRTVLFVSHNMGAVMQLCEYAIWLDGGRLAQSGQSADIVRAYLSAHTRLHGEWENPSRGDSNEAREVVIQAVRIKAQGASVGTVVAHMPFRIEINYTIRTPVNDCIVWLHLVNDMGVPVLTSLDTDAADWNGHVRMPGDYQSTCEIPGFLLKPQRYIVSVGTGVVDHKVFDHQQEILQFEVTDTAGFDHIPSGKRHGVITPKLSWCVSRTE